jgi:two-component system phosphate regulon sensor histidine kinase PhoR
LFKFPFILTLTSKIETLEKEAQKAKQEVFESLSLLEKQRGLADIILKSMSEGVIAVDKNGRVILANPVVEHIFNVLEPQILGKTIREAVFNNELADLFGEILHNQKMISKEMEIVTPVNRTFMAQGDIVRTEENTVLGAVCVLYDITEIRKLENYRSEFVANVSHELKTPLTAIRSFVETLLGGAIDDKEHNVEFLQKIEKHAVNLSQLIDDILEISRLESKTEIGPFDTVSLNRIILRAIDIVTEKAKKKQIQIKFASPGREPMVMGIEDHLYRAILNLLDNAVKYTPESGSITVSCETEGKNLLLKVTDTGIGIPAEHLPRIFERFYRVDKARSRELGGTGLGLAIVKHVMTLHHGTVSVESEEGKGTVFTLIFLLDK